MGKQRQEAIEIVRTVVVASTREPVSFRLTEWAIKETIEVYESDDRSSAQSIT